MAEQLTVMKGLSFRALLSRRMRVNTSLPTPFSPRSRTAASVLATVTAFRMLLV